MIAVKGLGKQYGAVKAVDDISFEVTERENLVLLGTSGCGKTTTLKMLNRLIEPTAGEIAINGRNIKSLPPDELRRGIGYVLQNTGLFPHYTIAENIAVVPKLLKWGEQKITARTQELLDKLHLSADLLNNYPGQLSGGQQQRVGLARALMADPPVLLMDEPFGALDNITRGNIQTEFKHLDELTRKTIVMVTHDVQEAFELGDRICLMDKGRISQIGTPSELLFSPADDFVSDFLQGQRLQLELKTVKVKDVWRWLPVSTAGSGKALPAGCSVWSAMEALKNIAGNRLVEDPATGETKIIDFAGLMAAYNRYQNKNAHE